MNLFGKLVISLVVAVAAWAAAENIPAIPSVAAFCAATVITTLLLSLFPAATSGAPATVKSKSPSGDKEIPDGPREQGEVKWFNVSKGFGFITKDDGEEIFVHFRSIRGEGRRSLKDGQRVSFIEAQSDKGPQAEDVEPL